jgi:hypothetical protein
MAHGGSTQPNGFSDVGGMAHRAGDQRDDPTSGRMRKELDSLSHATGHSSPKLGADHEPGSWQPSVHRGLCPCLPVTSVSAGYLRVACSPIRPPRLRA